MKPASAIVVAFSGLLGCGALSASSSSSSSSSAGAISTSETLLSQQRSRTRTKRLRKQPNAYKSTARHGSSTSHHSRRRRRRHLQLFQIFGPVPAPTTPVTPSGIFDVGGGGTTSTSSSSSLPPTTSPSSSVTSSSTSRQSSISIPTTPPVIPSGIFDDDVGGWWGEYVMNDLSYLTSDGCMSGFEFTSMSSFSSTVPSPSPSTVDLGATDSPTFMMTTVIAATAPPALVAPATIPSLPPVVASLPPVVASLPPVVVQVELSQSLSMNWNFDHDFDSMSMFMSIYTFPPGTSPPVLPASGQTTAPSPPPPAPVEENKCEFCSSSSEEDGTATMDESAIIPFSDETTCGMAKEIVIQLNATSEDCELARKAELICCPKTLAPSSSSMELTPVPTISFHPTEAPVPRSTPESDKSDGSCVNISPSFGLGVVLSSILFASSWVVIVE